jgi:PAS domain-containing protein
LLASGWKSAVHRDDVEQLETWWRELRQTQEAGTLEVRLRQSGGAYRWFQIAAKPIHDERAILIRWCGTNTD